MVFVGQFILGVYRSIVKDMMQLFLIFRQEIFIRSPLLLLLKSGICVCDTDWRLAHLYRLFAGIVVDKLAGRKTNGLCRSSLRDIPPSLRSAYSLHRGRRQL